MKLPLSSTTLEEKLAEFDLWITPSIQEIQDTEKYNSELNKVNSLIRSLGKATRNFSKLEFCNPEAIASTCIDLIEENISFIKPDSEKLSVASGIIESLCSLLFMVTGKSDNNLKCQFPVYLSQVIGRTKFPHKTGNGENVKFSSKSMGRTIKSDKISKLIADSLVYSNKSDQFHYLENEAKWLLGKYVESILKDKASITQFWALGSSYFYLHSLGNGAEKSLLAPIVIFKVRGSVSASGGHIPENILRGMMDDWGLKRGTDYNIDDVIIEYENKSGASKTRAYDFVLPFNTRGWEPEIFVQCQFYAGDSGSVSHKVVDQTQASRPLTLSKFSNARFIEYLDGAGYYSSLNTDLQHMLEMNTTKEFIQVRSAHIKLRRELQDIGFLIPVEIEHAIFRSKTRGVGEVRELLVTEGYSESEIDRSLTLAIERKLIVHNGQKLCVIEARVTFARQLLIIDITAGIGGNISVDEFAGKILIPGYGGGYGVSFSTLSIEIDNIAPNADYSRTEFAKDITWLSENKYIILR